MRYFLFSLFLTISVTIPSYGCDCNDARKPIGELIRASRAVFVGVAKSSKQSEKFQKYEDEIEYLQETEFEVIENLKGSYTKLAVLSEYSDCGQIFEIGKKYLVYAFYDKETGTLFIHRCHSYCPEVDEESGIQDLKEIQTVLNDKR